MKFDKDKWKAQSGKVKAKLIKKYFSEEVKYIIKRIKDYWIGYVEVRTQDILCGGYETNKLSHNELYAVYIICGRFNIRQRLSVIEEDIIEKFVKDWEFSEKKRFHLHLDMGYGISQDYTFSKRQKDMLIEQIKPLLEMEWYEDVEYL